MASNTPNLNLYKKDPTIDGNDTFNIKTMLNDNWDKIDTAIISKADKVDFSSHLADSLYQTAGGTATTITLTISGTLVTGYPITFIASANNNSAPTTINGKPLYKPGTTTAPTLMAGKAYTVWYNATSNCFFIKASAEGTVTADKVLAGETFSNYNDTGLVGTMPNRSGNGYIAATSRWADGNGGLSLHIPVGAYLQATPAGDVEITITDSNFISPNILSGKSIFGVTGTLVQGTLTAGENIWYRDTLQNSTGVNTYTKIAAVRINNMGGTVRVRFNLRNTVDTGYGRIYVNGIPRGVERVVGTTFVEFAEDITVNAGDEIQLYAHNTTATYSTYTDNFRICVGYVAATLTKV